MSFITYEAQAYTWKLDSTGRHRQYPKYRTQQHKYKCMRAHIHEHYFKKDIK